MERSASFSLLKYVNALMPSEMTNAMTRPVDPPISAPATRSRADSEASRTVVLSRL